LAAQAQIESLLKNQPDCVVSIISFGQDVQVYGYVTENYRRGTGEAPERHRRGTGEAPERHRRGTGEAPERHRRPERNRRTREALERHGEALESHQRVTGEYLESNRIVREKTNQNFRDGRVSTPVTGNLLEDMNGLLKKGEGIQQYSSVPIGRASEAVLKVLKNLRVSGCTALGPAMSVAVGIASKTPGSKIIVCTGKFSSPHLS
jgi:hypothetical protein